MPRLPRRSVAVLGSGLACAAALVALAAVSARSGAAAQTPELVAFSTPFLVRPAPAVMAKYSETGNWSSLWWLPKTGETAVPGSQVAVTRPDDLPHLIFVPPGSAPQKGWPLIVFLHGQGESSPSPLPMVALQGPPQHAGRHPTTLTFAVLSPQKPMRSQFFDDDVAEGIAALIKHYSAALSLDTSRVYLTGLSQGGIGTWNLASDAKYTALFAAIAPVCGGLRPPMALRARHLANMPIYAFHGRNDEILPVSMSDESVKACENVTRTPSAGKVKYDRIQRAAGKDYSWDAADIPHMEGHASWVNAYYPEDSIVGQVPLYDWFLSHSRPARSAAPE
jgi:predicted peptidase